MFILNKIWLHCVDYFWSYGMFIALWPWRAHVNFFLILLTAVLALCYSPSNNRFAYLFVFQAHFANIIADEMQKTFELQDTIKLPKTLTARL